MQSRMKRSVVAIIILVMVLICPGLQVVAAGYSGWSLQNGTWYFFDNGSKVINSWRLDSKGWCFLGADGSWTTNGWVRDSNGWCYIGSNGYWDGKPALAQIPVISQPIINCFPLMSTVPVPEDASYYKSYNLNSSTLNKPMIAYYYNSSLLKITFIGDYFSLLEANGWAYTNSGNDDTGKPWTNYYKNGQYVTVCWVGNDLVIMGTIH